MSQTHGSNFYSQSELADHLIQLLNKIASSEKILKISKALGDNADLHLVGGCVRNLALGKKLGDIDLATSYDPEKVIELAQSSGLNVYSTGIEHGTVSIHIDGENFEITTFRKPGPRNIKQFSESIEEDLVGRDFTINAIAYSLQTKELIDPFKGLEHLLQKRLFAVESASDRILEDPLRILRMIRFGPALGFSIDQTLIDAARINVEKLKEIHVERIRTEFEKILVSKYPRVSFQLMLELGILEIILPEILPSVGFEQNDFHTEDVFDHTMSVVEQSVPVLKIRLAALFHDFGKPHTLSIGDDGRRHFFNHEKVSAKLCKEIMQRLKFSKALTASVEKIVAMHMRPLVCGPAGVRRLLRDLDEDFNDWLLLKQADLTPLVDREIFKQELNQFLTMVFNEKSRARSPIYGKLAIDGNDLINLGMQPGKELGSLLKKIEDLVLEDPDLNQKEILLEKAKELIPC